jgi:DNA-binding IclR family transcriptional regulator
MATESTTPPPEDVNQTVKEEWKAETDAFERVSQVARETHEQTASGEIAERALVAKTTAIKHLKTLAEFGVVERVSEGGTLYWKHNEFHAAMGRADELAREYDTAELADAVREMKAEIERYRAEYDVESPEELARALDGDEEDGWEDLQEWQTTARNLAIAKLALTFHEVRDSL